MPVLPEKRKDKMLFRFDPEFVEQRRSDLQTFMFNVCLHPQLRDAPELVTFCSSSSLQLHASEPVHQALGAAPPSLSAATLAKAKALDAELDDGTERWEALERYV